MLLRRDCSGGLCPIPVPVLQANGVPNTCLITTNFDALCGLPTLPWESCWCSPNLLSWGVQLQLWLSALGNAGCRSPGREPSQHSLYFQNLEWFVYSTLWYPPSTTICIQTYPQKPGGCSKCCSQPWSGSAGIERTER